MKSTLWRVSADVPADVRARLLESHPPRLQHIYLQSITWAYGVDADFAFVAKPITAFIFGIHRTATHEAFVINLDGTSHRPDGSLIHLTLSTAVGVPPVQAGDIDYGAVELLPAEMFATQLKLRPCFVQKPTFNHAA